MKKFRLILRFTMCSLLTPFITCAQSSIGAEVAVPTGNLANGAGVGFGGFWAFEGLTPYKKLPKFIGGGSIGYIYMTPKTINVAGGYKVTSNTSLIPVLYRGKFYFKEAGTGLYGLLEAGYYFAFSKATTNLPGGTAKASSSSAGIAFGLGFKKNKLDFNARFNIGNASLIGFRAAYVLQKKK